MKGYVSSHLAVVIFSAEKAELSKKENKKRTKKLKSHLKNVASKQVEGCYKGVKESSFVCLAENLDLVLNLAKKYEQETILYLTESAREAILIYTENGLREKIGIFHQTSKENALKQDGYTYDPELDCYFII